MKQIKVEWCMNFIKSFFKKHCIPGGGVETNCFWKAAEKSGLWVRGTYGTPMSEALCELTKVEDVHNSETGEYLFSVFKLK